MNRTKFGQLGWIALALGLAACDVPSRDRDQADLGAAGSAESAAPTDSIEAGRDSLFAEVAENARLLNQIGEELNKIEGLSEPDSGTIESPASASRERLLHKVQQVTARLADSEKRLAQNRRQVRAATRKNDSLSGRVTSLETMLADFEAMIESQRTTLESLTERVTALETENLALRDTITTMETEENTAYYVVGTKEELLERGLITKEGGSRVLFIFGKRGETLVPARDLDTSQFTAIDIRQVTEIPLPDSSAEYLIASRQNLDALAGANGDAPEPPTAYPQYQPYQPDSLLTDSLYLDSVRVEPAPVVEQEEYGAANGDEAKTDEEKQREKGKVRGSVRIADPREFWMPSKFLIIVRT
jgi:hypothetical protein